MKFDHLSFDYDDAGRPEIIESVAAAMARYLSGEKVTGLQVAPRVGKQSIIVLLSNEAKAAGAPFVHCIVPWTNLSYQVVDASRNKKTFDFYKARGTKNVFRADVVETIPHHKYYCSHRNPQTLLCSTVQLLHANINIVVESVKHAIGSTGKRPVFIIDEAQLMGEGQSWYSMIERLVDAGAYIVSMTGTERRSDKKPIVGFEYKEIGESSEKSSTASVFKGVKVNAKGEKVASIATGTLRTVEYEVVPIGSMPVPISRAFDKGWCEGMDVKTFDFEILDISTGEKFNISQANAEKTRPNLIDWLMSDECIKMAAKHVLNDFIRRRVELGLSNAKAMFVTLSDNEHIKSKNGKDKDECANYHARKTRQEFLRQLNNIPASIRAQLGRVNAEICTSMLSDGGPDNASMEKLRRFALTEMDDKGKEPIDVLFVKNMGVVGLDVPALKTMVNLSNNSADTPTTLQANLRIATKWSESDAPALLILPAHCHGLKFRDMCGKWSNKIKVSTFEEDSVSEKLIQTREKEKFEVVEGSGKVHSYSTHKGEVIQGGMDEMETLVGIVRRKYKAANLLSYYQLVETIKQGAFPVSPEDEEAVTEVEDVVTSTTGVVVVNTDDRRKDLDDEEETYSKKTKRLTSCIASYGEDPLQWLDVYRKIDDRAKMICGVRNQRKKDIMDPEVLFELHAALDEAFEIVKSEYMGAIS